MPNGDLGARTSAGKGGGSDFLTVNNNQTNEMRTSETVKHTSGPWKVEGGQILTQERTGPCSHEIIAAMPAWFHNASPGHATQDHLAANARLIAAAPVLYEALQELYAMGEHQRTNARGEIQKLVGNAYAKARAAIALATGESEGHK